MIALFRQNRSVPVMLAVLVIFAAFVTLLSEGAGTGALSTSLVKTLGMTTCLAIVALAMDMVWGYAGILSLGHMAFFALGGYMIGMWLMVARTEGVIAASLAQAPLPPTPQELTDAVAVQIFGVVGGNSFPWMWAY